MFLYTHLNVKIYISTLTKLNDSTIWSVYMSKNYPIILEQNKCLSSLSYPEHWVDLFVIMKDESWRSRSADQHILNVEKVEIKLVFILHIWLSFRVQTSFTCGSAGSCSELAWPNTHSTRFIPGAVLSCQGMMFRRPPWSSSPWKSCLAWTTTQSGDWPTHTHWHGCLKC